MILGQPTQFWPTAKQVTGIGNLKHLQVSNNSTITRIRHDEISPFDDISLFKTPVDQNIGPINNAFFLTATALSLEDALSFHKHVRCHRDKTSVYKMCILPCFTMFYHVLPINVQRWGNKTPQHFCTSSGSPTSQTFRCWSLHRGRAPVLLDLYAIIST